MTLQIRPARESDLEFAAAALAKAGLPIDDLDTAKLAFTAECKGEVRGVIGLEAFGDVALLRSLVIAETARGEGVGSHLVAALEGDCAGNGVRELWLLTIDAEGFFARLGYSTRSREAVPSAIRATAEFSGLCPDDAVLMSKSLV